MARYDAFNPQGALTLIAAAVAAPTAVQLITPPTAAQQATGATATDDVEVINSGTLDAFLCHGTTAAAAAAIAALGIPVVGTPVNGMIHIPAGADKVYGLRSDEFYTAITASGTANLFLLPGRGQ